MSEISLFNLAAIVITLAAGFGYLNHRWLGLPNTIGVVLIALLASIGVIIIDALAPGFGFRESVRAVLDEIDFPDTLMKGVLSFLLFAGALHIDLGELLGRKWAIGVLATFGVLISTFLVGYGLYFATGLVGLDIPLIWCLVFGSLISPTDPVAVLGILKTVHVNPELEAKIAGESLFNDGVGIVVFTIFVALAIGSGDGDTFGAVEVIELFVWEALGGAVLGLTAGYIAYRAMKSINQGSINHFGVGYVVLFNCLRDPCFRTHSGGYCRFVDRQSRNALCDERRDP